MERLSGTKNKVKGEQKEVQQQLDLLIFLIRQ